MKLFNKHMALIAKLVLVITIAASSGLTAVLHTCMMDRMDCCGHSSNAGDCDCDLPGVPHSGPSISADFKCDTNTIIGGATIKLGEVEKEKRSELTRIVIATMTPSLNPCFDDTSGSLQSLFSLASPPLPASVEKCVLYASLLI